jgi:hypothetical protein
MSQVSDIQTGLNAKWTDLAVVVGGGVVGARDLFEQFPSAIWIENRKSLLRVENASLRGEAGVVTLMVERKSDSLIQVAVPHNVCEFIVYAEPHRLTLGNIRFAGPSQTENSLFQPIDSKSVRLPLDPAAWRDVEINRFILDETMRFLETTEAEIKRLNSAP